MAETETPRTSLERAGPPVEVRASDRRRHPRYAVTRPCKLIHRDSRRFVLAGTYDLSAGGAKLLVESPRPFLPGDAVDVAIGWGGEVVLARQRMVGARVVRAEPGFDGRQRIAIEFDSAQSVGAAAA